MLVLVILVVGETNLRLGCNHGGNRGGRSWLARLKAVEEVCKVIKAGLPKRRKHASIRHLPSVVRHPRMRLLLGQQ